MSRRNWFFVAALGLAFACANHANAEGSQKQNEPQEGIAKSLGNIAATYEQDAKRAQVPDKQSEPCKSGDDRRYSELCAQWKAADAAADSAQWAWASGIIGIGSLIGVLIAIGLAFHSNWIARDTAKKQLRAYMGTVGAVCDSRFGAPHLIVDIKNFGASPALRLQAVTNVSMFRRTEAGNPGRSDWFDMIGSFGQCEPTHSQNVTVIIDRPVDRQTMRLLLCETTLTFEDIFGQRRWRRMTYAITELSREVDGKLVMDIWQDGNCEGEGQPPLSAVNKPAI